MKKAKFKILGLIFLFFIVAITPSCDALLEALSEPTNQTDNNTTKDPKNADQNGQTNLGKKSGGIQNYFE